MRLIRTCKGKAKVKTFTSCENTQRQEVKKQTRGKSITKSNGKQSMYNKTTKLKQNYDPS